MTELLGTRAELAAWLASTAGTRAVVLTMGALHAGHEALMRAARAEVGESGTVLTTIFVNPAQFGPHEDFAEYPRTLEADLARCVANGIDAVFAPEVLEVYPPDEEITEYEPGPLANELEGAARPGHFAGVLKVVSRLLQLTEADVTFFGEKDYQQLTLVRRLMRMEPRLANCRVVAVPIMRAPDGLALSSRNRYLSAEQRTQALAIPETIALVRQLCADGLTAEQAAHVGRGFLRTSPGVTLDYVVVRSVGLGTAPAVGEARVLVAARVGHTRLLDNGPVIIKGHEA
ncbi:MAG: pantoate--beta-alanine ligase [Candidatus Nanopelagicales bacterium]